MHLHEEKLLSRKSDVSHCSSKPALAVACSKPSSAHLRAERSPSPREDGVEQTPGSLGRSSTCSRQRTKERRFQRQAHRRLGSYPGVSPDGGHPAKGRLTLPRLRTTLAGHQCPSGHRARRSHQMAPFCVIEGFSRADSKELERRRFPGGMTDAYCEVASTDPHALLRCAPGLSPKDQK